MEGRVVAIFAFDFRENFWAEAKIEEFRLMARMAKFLTIGKWRRDPSPYQDVWNSSWNRNILGELRMTIDKTVADKKAPKAGLNPAC